MIQNIKLSNVAILLFVYKAKMANMPEIAVNSENAVI